MKGQSLIRYQVGSVELTGSLFTPATSEKRPLALVAHTGLGLGDFERDRAAELAREGYVAFALDLYGLPEPRAPRRAAEEHRALLADRAELRARMTAALRVAAARPEVDASRVAAVGFCLGGAGVLELTRAGEPIRAAVNVHGTLSAPHGPSPNRVDAAILVLLGADDPLVAPHEIEEFEDEMRRHSVDYCIVRFGGAAHGFTEPFRGTAPDGGVAYHPKAARRAWRILLDFLEDALGPSSGDRHQVERGRETARSVRTE
jgi:dienelactone hydrolase